MRRHTNQAECAASDVRRILLEEFEGPTPQGHTWEVSGPVKVSRDCLLFRARTSRFDHDVAIKVFRPETHDTRTFNKQVKLLQDYSTGMGGSAKNFSVPTLLGEIENPKMILMEWIASPRLKTHLWKNCLHTHRRDSCVRAAGSWLRRFHEVKGLSVQGLEVRPLLARIEKMVRQSPPMRRPPAEGDSFQACLGALRSALDPIEGHPIPHARTHGDFNPSNVFHGPRGTVGYDFFSRRLGPITDDICRFLVYVQVYRLFQPPFSTAWALKGLDRDRTTFLQGYGPAEPELDQHPFRVLFLAETLRRWASVQKQLSLGTRGPWKRIELIRLKKLARSVAGTL